MDEPSIYSSVLFGAFEKFLGGLLEPIAQYVLLVCEVPAAITASR